MTTKQSTTPVWFKTSSNGQRRAYYWSYRAFRVLPLAVAKADLMIATGEAEWLAECPF